MQPIVRKGIDLPVQIVHGVVIRNCPGDDPWVRFVCMNNLPQPVRNLIHCGTPIPEKGKKDPQKYEMYYDPNEDLWVTSTSKIIVQQWRRGTLAYTVDESRSEVWAALTVYNPDDQGKHNYTKREGRWMAYRLLRVLVKNSDNETLSVSVFSNIPREIASKCDADILKLHGDNLKTQREFWMFKRENFIYNIIVPDCNFVPELEWAVNIQEWLMQAIANKDARNETV